MSDHN